MGTFSWVPARDGRRRRHSAQRRPVAPAARAGANRPKYPTPLPPKFAPARWYATCSTTWPVSPDGAAMELEERPESKVKTRWKISDKIWLTLIWPQSFEGNLMASLRSSQAEATPSVARPWCSPWASASAGRPFSAPWASVERRPGRRAAPRTWGRVHRRRTASAAAFASQPPFPRTRFHVRRYLQKGRYRITDQCMNRLEGITMNLVQSSNHWPCFSTADSAVGASGSVAAARVSVPPSVSSAVGAVSFSASLFSCAVATSTAAVSNGAVAGVNGTGDSSGTSAGESAGLEEGRGSSGVQTSGVWAVSRAAGKSVKARGWSTFWKRNEILERQDTAV